MYRIIKSRAAEGGWCETRRLSYPPASRRSSSASAATPFATVVAVVAVTAVLAHLPSLACLATVAHHPIGDVANCSDRCGDAQSGRAVRERRGDDEAQKAEELCRRILAAPETASGDDKDCHADRLDHEVCGEILQHCVAFLSVSEEG